MGRLGVVNVLYVSAIRVANSKNWHLVDRPLLRRGRSQALIVLRERMNAASAIAATAQVRFVRTAAIGLVSDGGPHCAANGLWLLSSPLFADLSRDPDRIHLIYILYGTSAVLFVGAYREFLRAETGIEFKPFRSCLIFLSLGNATWVLAEILEAPLAVRMLDDFPHLYLKYALLVPAFLFFLAAGLLALKTNSATRTNQTTEPMVD